MTDSHPSELRQAGGNVVKQAELIIAICEGVIRKVRTGMTLNELGELQGQGPMLDAYCAAYAARDRMAKEGKKETRAEANADKLNNHRAPGASRASKGDRCLAAEAEAQKGKQQ